MTTGKLRVSVIGEVAIGSSFADALRRDDSFEIASFDTREAPEFLTGLYVQLSSIERLKGLQMELSE
ncbi:hypothetical protein [Trinickia mobilis]|uniref:hypothetical protein n=1 Tax=Trinickia mobilis TaxID=2816356 RepID=UPI001A90A761|nr:hypothetical protein [Trinickia mobilis]